MERYVTRGMLSPMLVLAVAACASVPSGGSGGPTDQPLPPGTYQLTSYVTYHADSNVTTVQAHHTYTTRLYVQGDGTIQLYEDNRRCTPYAELPDDLKAGRRQPGPGYHFLCGDRTWYSDWNVWANGDNLSGKMSARLSETVQAGQKCQVWNYSSGRPVCEKYANETRTVTTTVKAPVSIRKVGA